LTALGDNSLKKRRNGAAVNTMADKQVGEQLQPFVDASQRLRSIARGSSWS
jgi:hypothetical protein